MPPSDSRFYFVSDNSIDFSTLKKSPILSELEFIVRFIPPFAVVDILELKVSTVSESENSVAYINEDIDKNLRVEIATLLIYFGFAISHPFANETHLWISLTEEGRNLKNCGDLQTYLYKISKQKEYESWVKEINDKTAANQHDLALFQKKYGNKIMIFTLIIALASLCSTFYIAKYLSGKEKIVVVNNIIKAVYRKPSPPRRD